MFRPREAGQAGRVSDCEGWYKHQGHAIRALLQRYVNDPQGLEVLKKYKQQFERQAALSDGRNAHYRVRSNFAVIYAAAALAIHYGILPWGLRSTFRAIEKCMRLTLATLQTGTPEPIPIAPVVDLHDLRKTLKNQLAHARILPVKPRQKVAKRQARARQKADGFKINDKIYLKPDPFKRWIPTQPERNALKEHKIIITERTDTPTVEKKIGGIKGKPRYYVIDIRALDQRASK